MPNRRHPRLQQLPGSVLGASTLVACQLAGDAIVHATAWPVPGAVLGMLLLWGLLCLLGWVGLPSTGFEGLMPSLLLSLMPGLCRAGRAPAVWGRAVALRVEPPALPASRP
jgi:hypothetical protein